MDGHIATTSAASAAGQVERAADSGAARSRKDLSSAASCTRTSRKLQSATTARAASSSLDVSGTASGARTGGEMREATHRTSRSRLTSSSNEVSAKTAAAMADSNSNGTRATTLRLARLDRNTAGVTTGGVTSRQLNLTRCTSRRHPSRS